MIFADPYGRQRNHRLQISTDLPYLNQMKLYTKILINVCLLGGRYACLCNSSVTHRTHRSLTLRSVNELLNWRCTNITKISNIRGTVVATNFLMWKIYATLLQMYLKPVMYDEKEPRNLVWSINCPRPLMRDWLLAGWFIDKVLFIPVQVHVGHIINYGLTIQWFYHHWFRLCLDAEQATSHYSNKGRLLSIRTFAFGVWDEIIHPSTNINVNTIEIGD